MRVLARLIYCLVPSMVVSVIVTLLSNHWYGAIAFLTMFGFSWDVTKTRPERGEGLPSEEAEGLPYLIDPVAKQMYVDHVGANNIYLHRVPRWEELPYSVKQVWRNRAQSKGHL